MFVTRQSAVNGKFLNVSVRLPTTPPVAQACFVCGPGSGPCLSPCLVPSIRALSQLLGFTGLGYVFDCIRERFPAWGAVNPPVQHIIPGDVGVEMMALCLLFKQSLQLR
jgi:hypothetical protein